MTTHPVQPPVSLLNISPCFSLSLSFISFFRNLSTSTLEMPTSIESCGSDVRSWPSAE